MPLLIHSSSQCDVCRDPFQIEPTENAPHAIPCGHIFCSNCLLLIIPPLCPLCRKPYVPDRIKRLHVDKPLEGTAAQGTSDEETHWLKKVMANWDAAEADLINMLEELDLWLGLSQPTLYAAVRKAREAIGKYQRLRTRKEQDKKVIKKLMDQLEKMDRMNQAEKSTAKAVEESLLAQIQRLEGQLVEKDGEVTHLQTQLASYRNNVNPLPIPPKPVEPSTSSSNNYTRVLDALGASHYNPAYSNGAVDPGAMSPPSSGHPLGGIYTRFDESANASGAENGFAGSQNNDETVRKDRKGKGKERGREGGHRSREHRDKTKEKDRDAEKEKDKDKDKDKDKGRQPYTIYKEPEAPAVGFIPPPSSSMIPLARPPIPTLPRPKQDSIYTNPDSIFNAPIVPTADSQPPPNYVPLVPMTPPPMHISPSDSPEVPIDEEYLKNFFKGKEYKVLSPGFIIAAEYLDENRDQAGVGVASSSHSTTPAAAAAAPLAGFSTQKQAKAEAPTLGSSSTYVASQPSSSYSHANAAANSASTSNTHASSSTQSAAQAFHHHHHHKTSRRKGGIVHDSSLVDGHMSEGGELLNSSLRHSLAGHHTAANAHTVAQSHGGHHSGHRRHSHRHHGHHQHEQGQGHHRSRRHSNAGRESVPVPLRPPPPYEPLENNASTSGANGGAYPAISGSTGYPAYPNQSGATAVPPFTATMNSTIDNNATVTAAMVVAATASLINGNPSHFVSNASSTSLTSLSSSAVAPPMSASASGSALLSSIYSLNGLNNGSNDVNTHTHVSLPSSSHPHGQYPPSHLLGSASGLVPVSSSISTSSSSSVIHAAAPATGMPPQSTISGNEGGRERGGSAAGASAGLGLRSGLQPGNNERNANANIHNQIQQYQQFHLQQRQLQQSQPPPTQEQPERWSGSSWGTVNTLSGNTNTDGNGSTSTLGWLPLRSFPVVPGMEPVTSGRSGQDRSREQSQGRDRRGRGESSRRSGSGSGSGSSLGLGFVPSFPVLETSDDDDDDDVPTGIRSAVTGANHTSIYETLNAGRGYGGTTPANGLQLRQSERRMSSPIRSRNFDPHSTSSRHQQEYPASATLAGSSLSNYQPAWQPSQNIYQPHHRQQGSPSSIGSETGRMGTTGRYTYDPRTPRASLSNSSHSNLNSTNSTVNDSSLMIHPTFSSTAANALMLQGHPIIDTDDEDSLESHPDSSASRSDHHRSPPSHPVPNRRNVPVRLPSSSSIASTIDLGRNRSSRASRTGLGLTLNLDFLSISETEDPAPLSGDNALGLNWDAGSASAASLGHGSNASSRNGSMRSRGSGAEQDGYVPPQVLAPTPIVSSRSFLRSWSAETGGHDS